MTEETELKIEMKQWAVEQALSAKDKTNAEILQLAMDIYKFISEDN